MRNRKWLIILLAIVMVMSLATYTGVTESFFTDDEKSTNDALGIRWGLFTLNDGFEGVPWDGNWDGNGTTDWQTGAGANGTYSAGHASGDTYLISDDLDTYAADNITISFWFKIKLLNKGPLYVQTYNGTAYNNWFDLVNYAGGAKNTWLYFSETITDSQYFKTNFRLRFDGSTLTTDGFIDDVLIKQTSNFRVKSSEQTVADEGNCGNR